MGYKVGAGSVPLQGAIRLTFQADGAWKGVTQSGTSSGTSWLDDDEIVLDGTGQRRADPIHAESPGKW
jgi:hypothetical protein